MKIIKISCENYESYENAIIQNENHANHEKLKLLFENNENQTKSKNSIRGL